MKRLFLVVVLFAGFAGASSVHAQRSDILPPARRAASLEKAAKLLEQPVVPAVLPTIKNPFAPPDFDRVDPVEEPPVAGVAPRARTAREVLEMIAASINPTGTMFMREEPILVFSNGHRRVGDRITASVDGVQYSVIISGIDRTSYTLRLNNEQISRPIKPGSQK